MNRPTGCLETGAGRDVEGGGTVILIVHLDAVNEREVIHVPGEVRKQFGEVTA